MSRTIQNVMSPFERGKEEFINFRGLFAHQIFFTKNNHYKILEANLSPPLINQWTTHASSV